MQSQYSPAIPARFWAKVNRDGPIHPYRPELGPCWLWTGFVNPLGYGIFRAHPWRGRLAHRFAYEMARGPLPPGAPCLHTCDNPPCVNPSHLYLGTPRDNAIDRERRGRGSRAGVSAMLNPSVRARGERQWKAKLTAEDVRAIRARYAPRSGPNGPAALAREYGVSTSTVEKIIARQTWAHIP